MEKSQVTGPSISYWIFQCTLGFQTGTPSKNPSAPRFLKIKKSPPKKSSSRPKQGSSIGSISSKHLFGNHQLLAGHREPQMLSCASNVGLYCLYSRVCFNNHLNLIGVYDFWKNKPGEITCCAQPKLVGTCGFVGLLSMLGDHSIHRGPRLFQELLSRKEMWKPSTTSQGVVCPD